MNIFNKTLVNIKSQGLKKTFKKIILRLNDIILLKKYYRNKNTKKILKLKTIEERFNNIYQINYWSDNESISGSGSNLESTKNIRFHLPLLIKNYKIQSILDAPCGDLNWMFHILKDLKMDYFGADIVDELIIDNKKKYENQYIKFAKKNIINDKLPKYDLMICRDCLFHLSYKDILLFFNNFLSSEIKFLLIDSHLNDNYVFKNKDIITGDFRLLDFFSEPFNFKKNFVYSFDDRNNLEIKNFKQMYLFSKSQIQSNLNNFSKKNIST